MDALNIRMFTAYLSERTERELVFALQTCSQMGDDAEEMVRTEIAKHHQVEASKR